MRETNFIKQKKDKWIDLERTMSQTHPDPDKLKDLFVQITDDLSHSRTFYPNRSVRVYLNSLAQQIFYSIYSNKKTTGNRLITFWTNDLPRVMYESRWEFLIALLIFWIPFIMGCLSGFMGEEEEFARQLLGNDYIDMTLANIQSGDPMAVYKDENKITMFVTIFLNNLMVSLRYFVVGALFTVGSIVSMVFWGLYVGAFQYFFFEQGELIPSILGIWTHGSLEIPESIIAGTAGIVLGKGLVFPGTYSRMQAFLLSARKGVKIIIGAVPLVLAAAFIECFITRLTDTPDILRASFITINFTFVLLYFVVLPYFLGTTNFMKKLPAMSIATGVGMAALAAILFFVNAPSPLILSMISIPVVALLVVKGFAVVGQFESRPIEEEEDKLEPEKATSVSFDRMKTAGEVFQDVFLVYRKNMGKIFMASVVTASIFLVGTLLFTAGRPSDIFAYPSGLEYFIEDFFKFISGGFFEESQYIGQFFNYKDGILSAMFITNTIAYSVLGFVSLDILKNTYNTTANDLPFKYNFRTRAFDFLKIFLIVLLGNTLVLLGETNKLFVFLLLVSLPFLFLWAASAILGGKNLGIAIGRGFKLLFTRIGSVIGVACLLGVVGALGLMLLYTPVTSLLLENLGYNVSASQDSMDDFLVVIVTFVAQTIFGMIFPLIMIGFGLLYYSQLEILEAKGLLRRIQSIGTGKRIRGLEREG